MSNLKCAVVFAALVTVSGIRLFKNKKDDVEVYRSAIGQSKAWEETDEAVLDWGMIKSDRQ